VEFSFLEALNRARLFALVARRIFFDLLQVCSIAHCFVLLNKRRNFPRPTLEVFFYDVGNTGKAGCKRGIA
jgi:hypothetical protein